MHGPLNVKYLLLRVLGLKNILTEIISHNSLKWEEFYVYTAPNLIEWCLKGIQRLIYEFCPQNLSGKINV